MGWWIFDIFAIVAFAILLFLLILVLFEPGLRYEIKPRPLAIDSDEFLKLLGALCDAQVHGNTRVDVLKNGDHFYPAELAAIASARETIDLEAYIFRKSRIGQQFIDALAERARAGVRVKLVVDAVGSLTTPKKFFQPLCDAGGYVAWYQPLRLSTFKRWNNRTHRKLMVIDGRKAFCGGADVGDEWFRGVKGKPPWRDTVFAFEGDLVTGLQSTFAENWLESSGKVLADDDYFPRTREDNRPAEDKTAGMVVNSTPSPARGTRAHILYQCLLAYAQKSIHITTPYFLPDRSALAEIVKAVRDRGLEVVLLTNGRDNNHFLARTSSRRRYGELLKAGVKVCEYQASMIHAKTMVVDGLWSVVGSSNFDNRSFGLNDEVNLALRNPELAASIEADFQSDLQNCERITLEKWHRRPIWEKVFQWLFRMLDRQF
jgi:cardiolipin synthase